MGILTLHELINLNRGEIINRCGATAAPHENENWMNQDVAAFLDQVMVELRDGRPGSELINEAATVGDGRMFQPYRLVGRSVIDLAGELNVAISADDVSMLDRSVDAAIAHIITRRAGRQKMASDGAANRLRDLTDTAISAFEVLQTGSVGVIGRTGTLVLRSLMDIRALTGQTT